MGFLGLGWEESIGEERKSVIGALFFRYQLIGRKHQWPFGLFLVDTMAPFHYNQFRRRKFLTGCWGDGKGRTMKEVGTDGAELIEALAY